MIFFIKRFLKQLYILSIFSPIAVLWIIKAFLFDWIAGKSAFNKLPLAGQRIGLKHIKSDYIKRFGELKGNINGHNISVFPFNSMNPIIRVKYKNPYKGLEIAFRKPYMHPAKNFINFKTSDRKFNKTFKTIRAEQNYSEQIKEDRHFHNLTVSFYLKHIFRLEALTFSENDIFCSLRYGFNIFPYIPSRKLESFTEELIELAEQIDLSLYNKN